MLLKLSSIYNLYDLIEESLNLEHILNFRFFTWISLPVQVKEDSLVIVNCNLKSEIVKKEILPLKCLMLRFDLSGHLNRTQHSGLSSVPGPLDQGGGALPRTGRPSPTAAREV